MKIAFDGQLFLKGNKTGIAWNAHNLILELAKYPENECVIQCFTLGYSAKQLGRLEEYKRVGCRVECCSWFKDTWYKWIQIIFPVPYCLFFHTKADITQFFNFTVPPGVKGKRITIVHDMAYKSCPKTVRRKTRIWLEISMKKTCRRADHFLTVSEFSKREMIRTLKIPKEKITVVPNAVDHDVYRPDYTKEQIQKVRNKYQIEQDYFLYLGTIEPRKNLNRLLDAYEKLCRTKEHVPQLVLAGGKGWLCADIYKKARKMNLGNKVIFIGYVEQADSPVLMCGASAFVFPSLYEGFGMPPLEAMACGTPVILSDTTSLPEVAGNAGIFVNPANIDDLYRAMRTVLEEHKNRDRVRMLGIQKASGYTWRISAEILMELYRQKNQTK